MEPRLDCGHVGRRHQGSTHGDLMDEPVPIETLWARRDTLGPEARAVDPAAVRALIERAEREGWDSPAVQADYHALLGGQAPDSA